MPRTSRSPWLGILKFIQTGSAAKRLCLSVIFLVCRTVLYPDSRESLQHTIQMIVSIIMHRTRALFVLSLLLAVILGTVVVSGVGHDTTLFLPFLASSKKMTSKPSTPQQPLVTKDKNAKGYCCISKATQECSKTYMTLRECLSKKGAFFCSSGIK